MWHQLKLRVQSENNMLNAIVVELVRDTIVNISFELWKKSIIHVIKIEDFAGSKMKY